MKKLYFFIPLLALATLSAAQPNFTGRWEGPLAIPGQTLRVVFNIQKDAAGTLTATLDSPDQGASGINCPTVSAAGDSVFVSIGIPGGAAYSGKINPAGDQITGFFKQGTAKLPLGLKKKAATASSAPRRPQTPKPPFDYASEDVEYDNSAGTQHFGATFTKPRSGAHFPVALLITGSGQQDRDETIFDHKPFAVIAGYLAKNGIAALRVDDRGMGRSNGDLLKATTADFALDVEASLAYLKARKDVDSLKIGLIGHSEGGMIAPMVAARHPEVAFIVLLAGPGVPIVDLMSRQNLDVLKSAGVDSAAAKDYVDNMYAKMVAAVVEARTDSAAAAGSKAVFEAWRNKTPAATVRGLTNVFDEASENQFIQTMTRTLHTPWWTYFMRQRPADALRLVRCPVLALNGEKDIQVAAEPNIAAIKTELISGKAPSFEVEILPGLNHLFQSCKKCSVEEYKELEETFSPEALKIMGEWIKGIGK